MSVCARACVSECVRARVVWEWGGGGKACVRTRMRVLLYQLVILPKPVHWYIHILLSCAYAPNREFSVEGVGGVGVGVGEVGWRVVMATKSGDAGVAFLSLNGG